MPRRTEEQHESQGIGAGDVLEWALSRSSAEVTRKDQLDIEFIPCGYPLSFLRRLVFGSFLDKFKVGYPKPLVKGKIN